MVFGLATVGQTFTGLFSDVCLQYSRLSQGLFIGCVQARCQRTWRLAQDWLWAFSCFTWAVWKMSYGSSCGVAVSLMWVLFGGGCLGLGFSGSGMVFVSCFCWVWFVCLCVGFGFGHCVLEDQADFGWCFWILFSGSGCLFCRCTQSSFVFRTCTFFTGDSDSVSVSFRILIVVVFFAVFTNDRGISRQLLRCNALKGTPCPRSLSEIPLYWYTPIKQWMSMVQSWNCPPALMKCFSKDRSILFFGFYYDQA